MIEPAELSNAGKSPSWPHFPGAWTYSGGEPGLHSDEG
jgi:hypothetical protein